MPRLVPAVSLISKLGTFAMPIGMFVMWYSGGRSGSPILILPVKGSAHPILTTERYLDERRAYSIVPCEKCGLDELFDPPSAIVAKVFPDLAEGTVLERFTSFCPLCRGAQQVVAQGGRASMPEPETDPARTQPPRRWWNKQS